MTREEKKELKEKEQLKRQQVIKELERVENERIENLNPVEELEKALNWLIHGYKARARMDDWGYRVYEFNYLKEINKLIDTINKLKGE